MRWAWEMRQRKSNIIHNDMVGKYEGKRTFGKHTRRGRRGNILILSRVGVTIDGAWTGNRIN
jgi:hypothetical protein